MKLVIDNAGQTATNWEPSAKQRCVLEAAAQAGLNRSITAIAKEAGVRRQTIYEWFHRDAGFHAAWDDLPRRMLSKHLPAVVAAQVQKAISGDAAAAKLIMSAAKLIGSDTVVGDQTSVTNLHLSLVQRADNWPQFQAIREAVQANLKTIDAEAKDEGPQPVNGGLLKRRD